MNEQLSLPEVTLSPFWASALATLFKAAMGSDIWARTIQEVIAIENTVNMSGVEKRNAVVKVLKAAGYRFAVQLLNLLVEAVVAWLVSRQAMPAKTVVVDSGFDNK